MSEPRCFKDSPADAAWALAITLLFLNHLIDVELCPVARRAIPRRLRVIRTSTESLPHTHRRRRRHAPNNFDLLLRTLAGFVESQCGRGFGCRSGDGAGYHQLKDYLARNDYPSATCRIIA